MRKTILCLSSYFPLSPGGAEYQTYLLAEEVKKRMDVVFLGIDGSGSCPRRMECNGYTLYHVPIRRVLRRILHKYYILDYLRVVRLMEDIAPACIYQRGGTAYTGIAAYYARRRRARMIWHIASDADVMPYRLRSSRRMIFDYLDHRVLGYGIRNSDHVVGQTEHQNRLLKQHYDRECDLVIRNFHPLPQEEICKSTPICVVWIANLKRLKQPELFLRLAHEFRDRKRDVQFVLIGRQAAGRWQMELDGLMKGLENLCYFGALPQDEVNSILAQSHLLVNTSLYEGFPNTFIQAWMRRVPVVSLNVDPDGVLVRENIGFRSGTFEQMVRDVRRLLHDALLREEMGVRAQSYALENHTIEKNVARLSALMDLSG
jgi:glycosyltransferase involved in cell wall biosynthesis